jgi:flagellar basal body-associated protein FliL
MCTWHSETTRSNITKCSNEAGAVATPSRAPSKEAIIIIIVIVIVVVVIIIIIIIIIINTDNPRHSVCRLLLKKKENTNCTKNNTDIQFFAKNNCYK